MLADEPTGALDTESGETVLRLLRSRCEAGAAGVLVTHEARHAAWADRVVFLRDGAMVDDTGQAAARRSTPRREPMSRWRPALRIARRTVRRNLGRSLLIAVLVGLPVAGATFVDVLVRSFSNPERSTYQQIGSADAQVTITGRSRLDRYMPMPNGGDFVAPGATNRPAKDVDLASELPAGSTWTEIPRYYQVRLDLGGGRIIRPQLVVADLSSPLTAQEARLAQGRVPSSADEVVVSEALAKRLGLLDSGGRPRRRGLDHRGRRSDCRRHWHGHRSLLPRLRKRGGTTGIPDRSERGGPDLLLRNQLQVQLPG